MEVAQLPPSGEQERVKCTGRAPAAPTHRVVKGAEVGCSLAGLTLGAGMGGDRISATPMQLRDAGGGDGGVGQEPITQAACLTL